MASESITIGCRLPHGLHLDVYKGEERVRVSIVGANKSRIIGGAGLTTIPKDHWDEWIKTHGKMDFIKSGAVFATRTAADAEAEAESRASDKTGFEGATPPAVDKRLSVLTA